MNDTPLSPTQLSVAQLADAEQSVLESRARAAFAGKRIPKRYRLKPVRSMGEPRRVWRQGHRHALRHKNRIPENVGAYKRRDLLSALRIAAGRGSVAATAILAEFDRQ